MFLNLLPLESTAKEETLTAGLLCCREELIHTVTLLSPITRLWRQQKRDSSLPEKI